MCKMRVKQKREEIPAGVKEMLKIYPYVVQEVNTKNGTEYKIWWRGK